MRLAKIALVQCAQLPYELGIVALFESRPIDCVCLFGFRSLYARIILLTHHSLLSNLGKTEELEIRIAKQIRKSTELSSVNLLTSQS